MKIVTDVGKIKIAEELAKARYVVQVQAFQTRLDAAMRQFQLDVAKIGKKHRTNKQQSKENENIK